jgi:DNA-directed RNA polymerase subunit RPC12/RpoP
MRPLNRKYRCQKCGEIFRKDYASGRRCPYCGFGVIERLSIGNELHNVNLRRKEYFGRVPAEP